MDSSFRFFTPPKCFFLWGPVSNTAQIKSPAQLGDTWVTSSSRSVPGALKMLRPVSIFVWSSSSSRLYFFYYSSFPSSFLFVSVVEGKETEGRLNTLAFITIRRRRNKEREKTLSGLSHLSHPRCG